MKISLERLPVESSKLQDNRQQSCVIRDMTVESARIIRSPREDERRQQRAVVADTGMHRSVRYGGAARRRHLLTSEHSFNRIRSLTGSRWRSSRTVLALWSNFLLPVMSRAAAFGRRTSMFVVYWSRQGRQMWI